MSYTVAIILALACLEVSLSFDNAVVNALVLKDMSAAWQRRFLLWGMPIAVFGMRLVFPVLIVAAAGWLPIGQIVHMAIYQPAQYAVHLTTAHDNIAAFGGIFLLMVFLGFILDETKEVHWIGWLESRLSKMGKMESLEISIALAVLVILNMPIYHNQNTCMAAGTLGLLVYVFINGLMGLCGDGENPGACVAKQSGLMRFIYLEILDASFSLDGVVGAFALTNNIFYIMIGLGIGAFAIRSLTIRLVRKGTLSQFKYLEHGAHWGIGALAVLMLLSTIIQIPQAVMAFTGMFFICCALMSSIREDGIVD